MLGPLVERLDQSGEDYRLLLMPDHPTPIACRTHTSDPVPYLLYDSRKDGEFSGLYNEEDARKSGIRVEQGYTLMSKLLERA